MKITVHNIVFILLFPSLSVLPMSCKMHPEEQKADVSADNNDIRLSESQIQLANINIAEAREGTIGRKYSLTGILKINEQNAITISSRVPGRIEKLFFKNTGESVKIGDKLYEFYSDDVVNVQRQYLTLQNNNWNFSGRYEPSLALENQLLLMGLLPSQIKQLGIDGKVLFVVTIYSPGAGKIKAINVSEGQYVTAGQPMYELAEDNTLWVEAQVYPDEIHSLKIGMPVKVTLPATGNLPVDSKISFINPSFETGKNVTLVRAVINNPDNRLHPGMLAIINLQTQITSGIIVPSTSVLRGADGDVVWVRREDGVFSCRKVIAGLQSGDSVLVKSGLSATDNIVTAGAYLLNSELVLKKGIGSSGNSEMLPGNNMSDRIETVDN